MVITPSLLTHSHTHTLSLRVISTEMGKKLAADWKASFVECSAKQNEVNTKDGHTAGCSLSFCHHVGCGGDLSKDITASGTGSGQ